MFFQETLSQAPQFFGLVPWIVFFPVIGLLFNIAFGKKILERGPAGEKIVGWVASIASGLVFLVSVLLLVSLLGHPEGKTVPLAEWIKIGNFQVNWAFQVDTLSVVMMLAVSLVGTLIHIYAIGYMHEDVRHNGDPGRFGRFFVFMNLFIASMMILVSSDNFLMLYVGWEGVGLCSYLLIGFWYEKGEDGLGNALAGKKAMITTRIGDVGMLLALFVMFWAFGSLDFHTIFEKAPQVAQASPGIILAITLFMLVALTGKSAQLPLYVWLPDAMAGPTPVSALIHAATMVTAGVYLVARSADLYILAPQAQTAVALVGGATALFAATIAVGQFDIKKVLAYSTISQLGFMVAAVGMGAFVAGMFHLVTHAFFKALLFLSAGSVIQGVERGEHHLAHDPKLKKHAKSLGHEFDPQDMRNMGGLRTRMKTTFWVYLIGAIALSGLPPLAGFWSKDEILAEANQLNVAVYVLLTLAAVFTAFYMARQILMVFFGKPRSAAAEHAEESPPLMTIPLMILAALTVLGGVINLPEWHTLEHWIEHTLGAAVHKAEFVMLVAVLSTGLSLLAIVVGWWIYNARRYEAFWAEPAARRPDDPLRRLIGPLFDLWKNKYWVDELYWAVILNPYIALSRFLADVVDWRFWHDWFHDQVLVAGFNRLTGLLAVRIDLGIIDGIANGLGKLAQRAAATLRLAQTGFVRNYALSIFLGVVIILGYLLLR
ncbi:MAG: NADH-quinone oxidoreductase subunit L [Anaerolineales bacterium]|nr:NADH-quinone oxidoreductase subunit L [Anaerolineales bacterium]